MLETRRGTLPMKDDNMAASPQANSAAVLDKNQSIGKRNGGGRNQV